jgi:hypothetical protein
VAIDGVQYALEGQFNHVNVNNSNDIVVVSVLYQLGGVGNHPPPLPSTLLQMMSLVPDIGNNKSDILVPLAGTWPSDTQYFQYQGSLTEPPCTENVNWLVLTSKLNVTQAQIDRLVSVVRRSRLLPRFALVYLISLSLSHTTRFYIQVMNHDQFKNGMVALLLCRLGFHSSFCRTVIIDGILRQ